MSCFVIRYTSKRSVWIIAMIYVVATIVAEHVKPMKGGGR